MKLTGLKSRAAQGVILALGAPGGWLSIRLITGSSIKTELESSLVLYAYLLVPTTIAFAGFGAVIGIHEDRLEEANRKLEELSLTDPLTGLKNLRYFQLRLEEERAAAERKATPLAIAIIDLDRFKRVNDLHGHQVGDDVLIACAQAILSAARRGETAARIGGEEFALLLPGDDGEAASRVGERVRRAIERVATPTASGEPVRVTASVGVASSAGLGSIEPRLLHFAADTALYRAKREGRNRVTLALPSDLERG